MNEENIISLEEEIPGLRRDEYGRDKNDTYLPVILTYTMIALLAVCYGWFVTSYTPTEEVRTYVSFEAEITASQYKYEQTVEGIEINPGSRLDRSAMTMTDDPSARRSDDL